MIHWNPLLGALSFWNISFYTATIIVFHSRGELPLQVRQRDVFKEIGKKHPFSTGLRSAIMLGSQNSF